MSTSSSYWAYLGVAADSPQLPGDANQGQAHAPSQPAAHPLTHQISTKLPVIAVEPLSVSYYLTAKSTWLNWRLETAVPAHSELPKAAVAPAAASPHGTPAAPKNQNQGQNQSEHIPELNGTVHEVEGWFTPTYKHVSSLMSYVYTGPLDAPLPPQTSTTNLQISPDGEATPTAVWSWYLWNPFAAANTELDTVSDNDLLRSARLAIEANKDSFHYAFKNSRTHQFTSSYGELAVSHTKTEAQPVRYKYKRVPLAANQVQESGLSSTSGLGLFASSDPTNATNGLASAANLPTSTPGIGIGIGLAPPSTGMFAARSNANAINRSSSSTPEIAQSAAFGGPKTAPEHDTIDLRAIKQTSSPPPGGHTNASRRNSLVSGGAANGNVSSASSVRSGRSERSALSTYRNFIVLPTVEENFRTLTISTKLRLLGEHFIQHDNTLESHLYRSTSNNISRKKTRKIKKIVIVGIHGFFPFKMVKSLIGESTGNSMTFTNEATKAMYKWLESEEEKAFKPDEVDIETIALEGKGKIENRVENLYKLLLNWIEVVKNCDFLFVIGHSQGSVVAISLLAKLLTSNHLRPDNQKIGLLSMCGILEGPYQGLENKIVTRAYTQTENEILSELFEFQKAGSKQSNNLIAHLKALVSHNVKINLAGSINDQLIPMYSSLAIGVSHPNIYRSINVGENCDYPEFIVTLLKIILLLMNLGHGDHGLIIEISKICMGTIYKGGHSKVYLNNEVYYQAIKHSIETTSLNHPMPLTSSINGKENAATIHSDNIYLLPWQIRELLQDLGKTKHINSVSLARKLINDYKNWEPTQKNWREVKFCLEGLEEFDIHEIYN